MAFEELQKAIDYNFKDENLVELALTHRSVNAKNIVKVATNVRLAILGSNILSAVILDILYKKYSEFDEGELSINKSKIVNTEVKASHAKQLKLQDYFKVGLPDVIATESALANAFEALIGAIYLDGGFDNVYTFVLREYFDEINKLDTEDVNQESNLKGRLQEVTQRRFNLTPNYKPISVTGPSHNPLYICAVYCGADELGRGTGPTRKIAEANAAKEALIKLGVVKPA